MEDRKIYVATIARKETYTGKSANTKKAFATEKEAFGWVSETLDKARGSDYSTKHVKIEERTYRTDGLVASSNARYYYEW